MSARAQMYALSRVCRRPADTLMRWLASYCGFGGPCIKNEFDFVQFVRRVVRLV
jgi:hypothetical protein